MDKYINIIASCRFSDLKKTPKSGTNSMTDHTYVEYWVGPSTTEKPFKDLGIFYPHQGCKNKTRIYIYRYYTVSRTTVFTSISSYIIYFPVFCMQYRCRSKRGVVEHLRICDLNVNVGTTILHWHATLSRP